MRISEQMKTAGWSADLRRSMERILRTQSHLSSARRIHRPSDDPAGTARLMRLKSDLRRYDRYEKNIEDADRWLMQTEAALNDVQETVTEAGSLLLQAASDTTDVEAREVLARRMQGLLEHATQLANTRFDEGYLFAGTENDRPPFDLTGTVSEESFTAASGDGTALDCTRLVPGSVRVTSVDGATIFEEGVDFTVDHEDGIVTVLDSGSMSEGEAYLASYETSTPFAVPNGDDTTGGLFRKVDEESMVQINVSAETVFGGDDGILDTLRRSVAVLERGDAEALRDLRTEIEKCLNGTTQIQGEVGMRSKRLELQAERLQTNKIHLREVISRIEDTDIAEAALQLQKEQVIYETALRMGAELMQMSLLDFI